MKVWRKIRSGFYRYLQVHTWKNQEEILAEAVLGKDGKWWICFEYPVRSYDRCHSLKRAKVLVEHQFSLK